MIIERTWELTTDENGEAGFVTPPLKGWYLYAIEYANPDSSNHVATSSTSIFYLAKSIDEKIPNEFDSNGYKVYESLKGKGKRIEVHETNNNGFPTDENFIAVPLEYVSGNNPTDRTGAFNPVRWRGFICEITNSDSTLTTDDLEDKRVDITLYLTDNRYGLSGTNRPEGFK